MNANHTTAVSARELAAEVLAAEAELAATFATPGGASDAEADRVTDRVAEARRAMAEKVLDLAGLDGPPAPTELTDSFGPTLSLAAVSIDGTVWTVSYHEDGGAGCLTRFPADAIVTV